MKIIFLGVWMVPENGDTVSFVVELPSGEKILVDSGVNTVNNLIDAHIDPCSITHLIITHSHGDHIAGLPMYLFYRYKYAPLIKRLSPTDLQIVTTPDTWISVKDYIDIAYPSLSNDSHLLVEYVDNGTSLSIADNFNLRFLVSNHNPVTIGFKLIDSISNKSIVYSADTAICETIFEIAEETDCLIHDVVANSMYPMLGKAGHSLCKDVGEWANRKKVKRLVPVHRLPVYKDACEAYEKEIRNVFHGELFIPADGDSLEI